MPRANVTCNVIIITSEHGVCYPFPTVIVRKLLLTLHPKLKNVRSANNHVRLLLINILGREPSPNRSVNMHVFKDDDVFNRFIKEPRIFLSVGPQFPKI